MNRKSEGSQEHPRAERRVTGNVISDQQQLKEETLRWISEKAVRRLRVAWRDNRKSVIH